jgi:hypothetical protein
VKPDGEGSKVDRRSFLFRRSQIAEGSSSSEDWSVRLRAAGDQSTYALVKSLEGRGGGGAVAAKQGKCKEKRLNRNFAA